MVGSAIWGGRLLAALSKRGSGLECGVEAGEANEGKIIGQYEAFFKKYLIISAP